MRIDKKMASGMCCSFLREKWCVTLTPLALKSDKIRRGIQLHCYIGTFNHIKVLAMGHFFLNVQKTFVTGLVMWTNVGSSFNEGYIFNVYWIFFRTTWTVQSIVMCVLPKGKLVVYECTRSTLMRQFDFVKTTR